MGLSDFLEGPGGYFVPGYNAYKIGKEALTGTGMFERSSEFGQIDPEGNVGRQAGEAGAFADVSQLGVARLGNEANDEREFLRRLARGENSLAGEQLRQGLQQNIAGQQAMAASASPANSAMAARTAAMQAARLGSGMAGQQAMAGIAERNAAQQSLMNAILAQRHQDLQAALGSRRESLQGYLGLEDARAKRYAADMGVPSTGERLFGLAGPLLAMV